MCLEHLGAGSGWCLAQNQGLGGVCYPYNKVLGGRDTAPPTLYKEARRLSPPGTGDRGGRIRARAPAPPQACTSGLTDPPGPGQPTALPAHLRPLLPHDVLTSSPAAGHPRHPYR